MSHMSLLPNGDYAIARQTGLLREADEERLALIARNASRTTGKLSPARRVLVASLLSRLQTLGAR